LACVLLFASFAGVRAQEANPLPFPAAINQEVAAGQEPSTPDRQGNVYLPWVATPRMSQLGLSRAAADELYRDNFLPYQRSVPNWSGSIDNCEPGTIGSDYLDALRRLINYYRQMAGIPSIRLDGALNGKSQAAALLMAANHALSHHPPSSWNCYSDEASQGAGSSNLALYSGNDPKWIGITSQMSDPGPSNDFVGHRRWILYPQTQQMGVGVVPPESPNLGSTALWVFDPDHMRDARPAVRDGFVAWPPPGYVPRQVVYERWSYSYPGADFANARVAVTMDGAPLAVTVASVGVGYGENTLVWTPAFNAQTLADGREHRFIVTLSGLVQGGKAVDVIYTVIVYSPPG
jgi:uncharacterized protein YkwD